MCQQSRRIDTELGARASKSSNSRRFSMSEKLEGIVSPAIDNLLNKVDSKYELVIFASKRARQINDYYSALHEGSLLTMLAR